MNQQGSSSPSSTGSTVRRRVDVARGVLTLLSLLLVAGCSEGPRLDPLSEQAVILAFGDSLTRGTGAATGQGYPEVLASLTGLEVVNAGVPGEESDAALERLPGVMQNVRPALVILAHGGNDLLRKRDLERTEANLRRMVRLVRKQGAQVVMLGIPKPGIFLGTHPMYPRLADALGVPLQADTLTEILAERDLKSDTIHPNAAGYRLLADAVHRLLIDEGAVPMEGSN